MVAVVWTSPGPEYLGEAEVGAVEIAIEPQHRVKGFGRTCRPGRRTRGQDVVAQVPALVGELVHKPPAAAIRFDQPKLVELVATCLIELRPERDQVGVGHWPRLGHQDEKDSSLGTRQVARSDAHGCQRSG